MLITKKEIQGLSQESQERDLGLSLEYYFTDLSTRVDRPETIIFYPISLFSLFVTMCAGYLQLLHLVRP